jgi:hypothetical protein
MVKACSCGERFEAKRPSAKYCSDRCRKRAQRSPGATGTIVALGVAQRPPDQPEKAGEPGSLETAARAELEAVGRADTVAGAVVLALARRLDAASPAETGAAFAALAKELRAALVAAVAGAERAADPIDELRAHAERKRKAR